MALASSLASVLVGKSRVLTATLGGSPLPPPRPNPLEFPGFTVMPVSEPAPILLGLISAGLGWWHVRRHRKE